MPRIGWAPRTALAVALVAAPDEDAAIGLCSGVAGRAGSRRSNADLDSADIIEAFSVASGRGGDDDMVEVAEDDAAAE